MKPDYPKWIRKELWTIFQGACLAVRSEPTNGDTPKEALSKISDTKKRNLVNEIYDHAKDATETGSLRKVGQIRTVTINGMPQKAIMNRRVTPAEFVAWLSQRGDFDIPAELMVLAQKPDIQDGLTCANDEVTCRACEQICNGKPIDWRYWSSRQAISPTQGAKLAHCIDPITWPENEYKQGPVPKWKLEKIDALAELLTERSEKWTLSTLVIALGVDFAPFAMKASAGRTEQDDAAAPDTEKSAQTNAEKWKSEATSLGTEYVKAWRIAGYEPRKGDVAFYLEGEFSTRQIYGKRGGVLDATYIERHALRGITGRKPGHRSKKPKVPDGQRGKLPNMK